MEINWDLGAKKKILYAPDLRKVVFAQRIGTKLRSRFYSQIQMFKILIESSRRKQKTILLKDTSSTFVRDILKNMYILIKKMYKNVQSQVYFQIDICLKGNFGGCKVLFVGVLCQTLPVFKMG